MKPLVTIGILFYNQENYVFDAIQSVLDQTYENIEVIIFDDCSMDDTVNNIKQRISELEIKTQNVIVHLAEKNSGNISANVNHIVRLSHGSYVKILGGDDMLDAEFVEKTVSYLEQFRQYGLVVTNGVVVDKDYRYGNNFDENKTYYKGMPDFSRPTLFYALMLQNLIFAPGVMIRKKVYDKLGLHDEQIKYEDYEFWVRCAKNKVPIGSMDVPLVIYRRAESSVTALGVNTFLKIKDWIKCETAVKDKYLECFNHREQVLIVIRQCCYPAKLCNEHNYTAGLDLLEDFANKYGIRINLRSNSSYNCGYSPLYGYYQDDNVVKELVGFCKNNSIRRIALYGFGDYGKRIYGLLRTTGIQVEYIVDRNPNINPPCEHITPNDRFREVDAVFITSSYDVESIIEIIRSKIKCKIYSMDDIEYEMFCKYLDEK